MTRPLGILEFGTFTIAAMSLAMKIQSSLADHDHDMIASHRRMLQHLIQADPQVTLQGVFQAEQRIFRVIGFVATVTTPLEILEGLCVALWHLHPASDASRWQWFGSFLL